MFNVFLLFIHDVMGCTVTPQTVLATEIGVLSISLTVASTWMKQQQYGFDPSIPAAAKSEEPQQSKRKSSLHESTANSYAECYPG